MTARASRRATSVEPKGKSVVQFVKGLASVARAAGERWADDACYRLGASLAYYALFSIFPLLLLSVTAVGFFVGDGAGSREKLLSSVSSPSPEFRVLLDQTLESMQSHRTARGIGAAVGVVALFLGASGVFSELESTLDFIWRVKAPPSKGVWSTVLAALRSKAVSFAVVVGAGFALLVSLAVSTALGTIGTATANGGTGRILWSLVEAVVALAFLTLLLAAVYRVVPHAEVEWGDVLGAALLTSLLFTGLKWLLAWYLAHIGSFAAYGAVGGVLGLLTWIYVASLVLFYGAEFSRVYAERFGSLAKRPQATPPSG